MDTTRTPDQQAGRLASLQYGAITLDQALSLGLTDADVRERIRSGRWHRAARATYVLAGAPPTWQQALAVACFAGPDGTVASHLSAAALFGLWKPPPLPQVTVPPDRSGRLRVAVVHHSPVRPQDATRLDGIPVTRSGRTLVDCASVLGYEPLCELVDDVLCRSLTRVAEIREAMGRASQGPGRAGLARLERALAAWDTGARPGSQAEMRLVRRLERWGFPTPQRQIRIYDETGVFLARIDLGWAPRRVGLEYYGALHHGPRQEEHDASRKARAEGQGWQIRVVRKDDLRGGRARALQQWLHAALAA